tara:strand:- start:45 stop:848 length:804 start_codon:yes stop_codon:yes gene_type:complete
MDEVESELKKKGITITGKLNPTGYKIVVPFSGGKDSQTCLTLALQHNKLSDVLALFCDTKYEHPITYKHVTDTCERLDVDLVTLNAGSVDSICRKYGRLPGGGSRHCTDELKIRPSKFFYKALAEQQGGFEVWIGVRSAESPEREKRYRGKVGNEVYPPHEFMTKYPKYLEKLGVMFRLPIIDWATSEVFEALNGTENSLYSKGFDRVGCFPCLAGGEKSQMRAFHFDEVGKKHFQIAESIASSIGREVLVTKKYRGQGPGCSLCSI